MQLTDMLIVMYVCVCVCVCVCTSGLLTLNWLLTTAWTAQKVY